MTRVPYRYLSRYATAAEHPRATREKVTGIDVAVNGRCMSENRRPTAAGRKIPDSHFAYNSMRHDFCVTSSFFAWRRRDPKTQISLTTGPWLGLIELSLLCSYDYDKRRAYRSNNWQSTAGWVARSFHCWSAPNASLLWNPSSCYRNLSVSRRLTL